MAQQRWGLVKGGSGNAMQVFHQLQQSSKGKLVIIKQIKRYGQQVELTQMGGGGGKEQSGVVLTGSRLIQSIRKVEGYEDTTLMIFQQSWEGEEVSRLLAGLPDNIRGLLEE